MKCFECFKARKRDFCGKKMSIDLLWWPTWISFGSEKEEKLFIIRKWKYLVFAAVGFISCVDGNAFVKCEDLFILCCVLAVC